MELEKQILDKHLKKRNLTNEHIHIAAYGACLDAIQEALNIPEVIESVCDCKYQTACLRVGAKFCMTDTCGDYRK